MKLANIKSPRNGPCEPNACSIIELRRFQGTNTDTLTPPDCNLNAPGACNVAFTTGKNNISVVRFGINYKL